MSVLQEGLYFNLESESLSKLYVHFGQRYLLYGYDEVGSLVLRDVNVTESSLS